MNDDAQLKLMAYLDGELPAEDVADIENLIKVDQEAAELVSELRWAQEAISGNELEIKVPETREFYWSKISKAIEFEAKQAERTAGSSEKLKWWNKFLLPFAGVAAVALVFTFANPSSDPTTQDDPGLVNAEDASVQLDEYYDEQEQTSMIWVTTDSEEEEKKRNRLNQDDTF
jgi:anti-sigma-K factor RskA